MCVLTAGIVESKLDMRLWSFFKRILWFELIEVRVYRMWLRFIETDSPKQFVINLDLNYIGYLSRRTDLLSPLLYPRVVFLNFITS